MRYMIAACLALVFALSPARAQNVPEMALLDDVADVVLLNKGGKRQLIESFKDLPALWRKKAFQKVSEGETCRMKKGALLMKVGPGSKPDTVRVRNMLAQTSKGGCPFWSEFDLNTVRYDVSRRIFEIKTKELF